MPIPTPIPALVLLLIPEGEDIVAEKFGFEDCVKSMIKEVGEELVMTVEANTEDEEVVVPAKAEDEDDEAVAPAEAEFGSMILNVLLENAGDVLPGSYITKKALSDRSVSLPTDREESLFWTFPTVQG